MPNYPIQIWFLPELYRFLEKLDVTVRINHVSRYVIDPNRDDRVTVYDGNYRNTVAYRKNSWGNPIYTILLTDANIQQRIADYHTPYHAALEQLLEEKKRQFGYVYLLDCHSFADDCIEK